MYITDVPKKYKLLETTTVNDQLYVIKSIRVVSDTKCKYDLVPVEDVLGALETMQKRDNEIKKNGSGYYDPTAYQAIKNTDSESERFHKLLDAMFTICELSDFRIEGRVVLKDKQTGRVWR